MPGCVCPGAPQAGSRKEFVSGRVPRTVVDEAFAGRGHELRELSRLDVVSADCRSMLEAAASIGYEFDLVRLAAACGLTEARRLAALDEAALAGLVRPVENSLRFAFSHARVRDALRDRTSAGRREPRDRPVPDGGDGRPAPEDGAHGSAFRFDGDTWTIAFGGKRLRVRDAKGIRYLAHLIARPRSGLPLLDLVSAVDPGAAGTSFEQLRVNVTKAVRGVIRNLASLDPALGRHLESAVHTGRVLSYVPDPGKPAPFADASRSGTPPSSRPLVGREREVLALDGALRDALGGRGRLVLLAGPDGIGRTRLALEIERRAGARGMRTFWGRCRAGGGAPAYRPWIEILRALVGGHASRRGTPSGERPGRLRRVLAALGERETTAGASPEASEAERFALFDAAASVVKEIACDDPLLLIFDDLHLADPSSLLLARFVARDLRRARILLLGTLGEDERRDADRMTLLAGLAREGETIHLPPLGRSDIARLLEAGLGNTPPASFVDDVCRSCDGIPLLVERALRTVRSSGTALVRGRPPAVLARRLDAVSPDCRRLLRAASVVGREFDLADLRQVTDLEAGVALELLAEARSAGLVRERAGALPAFGFPHAWLHRSLYAELPPVVRSRLHGKVARGIERRHGDDPGPRIADLARHLFEAARLGTDARKAAETSGRAADRARSARSFAEATGHYERALQALELCGPSDPTIEDELRARLNEARLEAARVGTSRGSGAAPEAKPDRFRLEGRFWNVVYDGKPVRLCDSKGCRYVARLLASPGVGFPALELAAHAVKPAAGRVGKEKHRGRGVARRVARASGERLDGRTEAEYRRRLGELRSELEEAERFQDAGRVERARGLLEALTGELTAALAPRRDTSSAERARVAVTKAIRQTVARIEAGHPALAEHLRASLRTGRMFRYAPPSATSWTVDD